MIKSKVFLRMLLILFLFFIMNNPVVATEFEISANQLFFLPQSGQWWKMRINNQYTQGIYLEYLQIERYYQQIGAGLEVNLLHRPSVKLWGLFGGEGYQLSTRNNNFLRTGLRLEFAAFFPEIHVNVDLLVDDQLGWIPRYYLEMKSSEGWVQSNLGLGNLLGTADGLAFWVGIEI